MNKFKARPAPLEGAIAASIFAEHSTPDAQPEETTKRKKKKKPVPPKPKARPVPSDARSEVFGLLREKMAYKAQMTGHTLEDTRMLFEKCTPKALKRPGEPPVKLNTELFKIALRRLELELDPQQVDLITASLDLKGTGRIDPTDFFQEAHNFRHHRRTAELGRLKAPDPKPLSPPTWLSPRGRPFDPFRSSAAGTRTALLAGVTSKVASERSIEHGLAPAPSVTDIVSQTSRVPFPSESGPIYADYLLKGRGRLSSPSSDMRYAAALISPRYNAAPPPKEEIVETPHYVQVKDRAKAVAYRPDQPDKWLQPGGQNGWMISLPTRSVPAYVHGGVHDMAANPPRHRGTTHTNLGYASSPRIWGDLQRGVLSAVPPVRPAAHELTSHQPNAPGCLLCTPCQSPCVRLSVKLTPVLFVANLQLPPSLGEVPVIPDARLATLKKMPSMGQCLDEISRAKSLRLSERSSKEREANASAPKPQKKATAA